MAKRLVDLRAEAVEELVKINNIKDLDSWKIRFLGKKSKLAQILHSLAKLPIEERREVGAQANKVKMALESSLAEKRNTLQEASLLSSLQQDKLDVTLPGRPVSSGHIHPITQTLEEISDILRNMGFQIVEGPDVEWDYYNFEALNIPQWHPARDMFATLWIDTSGKDSRLLRTHTSPTQIRVMEKTRPPIRVIAPGRVYRYEATDATHESMFYQIEGLAIDKNVTMANLKDTLFELCYSLFGKEIRIRFRCDYFPFVEPGVEVAIECLSCHGSGCRICNYSGWLEILGAGMVHPDVLRRANINPDIYSGFAFGLGIERIPMLRYGVDDIRLFYRNDLRFLQQF